MMCLLGMKVYSCTDYLFKYFKMFQSNLRLFQKTLLVNGGSVIVTCPFQGDQRSGSPTEQHSRGWLGFGGWLKDTAR